MKTLIYLHGFNSSPQSEKARLTDQYFEAESSKIQLVIPALPPSPKAAVALVEALVHSLGLESVVGFIGSSLGGYYSLYLQSVFKLPIVLVNPAVQPYTLLLDYLGENTNLYTGESYIIEAIHMDELKSIDVNVSPTPESVLLLTQTADEVLPYQQAVSKLAGAKMWIQYGGSHAFENFDQTLPAIKSFFESNL